VSPFAPISLDRGAEVPLGVQLTWIVRARITGGELAPGERLPGAREIAAQAGVNVNTVRTVFARLEEEGLLTVVHGKGTFVAGGTAPASVAGRAARPGGDEAAALAAEVISEARRRGIDPRALAAALYVHPAADINAAGASRSDADQLAARRALRAEIAGLERELAELPALPATTDAASARATPYPSRAGRLLTVAELTRQRDELAEQLARARAARQAPVAPGRSTVTAGARLRWVPMTPS
jgi:DNA-binding transcriptional regulator YhcF (GntR family)